MCVCVCVSVSVATWRSRSLTLVDAAAVGEEVFEALHHLCARACVRVHHRT